MRVDDYKNAIALAASDLTTKDSSTVAAASGADWNGTDFSLTFMNRVAKISGPDFNQITWVDQKEDETFNLTDAVLILHYLNGAKHLEPTGDMVAYRQIPGGEFYTQAFKRRAEVPLAGTFGHKPGLLTKVANLVGGQSKPGLGDEAFIFRVLPHLDILVLIHFGDDEFEPDGQVLFDRIIGLYLNMEDISWLGSSLVYRLMGLAKNLA